jgi:hypothetical protein
VLFQALGGVSARSGHLISCSSRQPMCRWSSLTRWTVVGERGVLAAVVVERDPGDHRQPGLVDAVEAAARSRLSVAKKPSATALAMYCRMEVRAWWSCHVGAALMVVVHSAQRLLQVGSGSGLPCGYSDLPACCRSWPSRSSLPGS